MLWQTCRNRTKERRWNTEGKFRSKLASNLKHQLHILRGRDVVTFEYLGEDHAEPAVEELAERTCQRPRVHFKVKEVLLVQDSEPDAPARPDALG